MDLQEAKQREGRSPGDNVLLNLTDTGEIKGDILTRSERVQNIEKKGVGWVLQRTNRRAKQDRYLTLKKKRKGRNRGICLLPGGHKGRSEKKTHQGDGG